MADAPDAVYRLNVSPSTRIVLLFLWRHAQPGELIAWPSVSAIMDATGMARRSVERCLATLRDVGAIDRCARPGRADAAGGAWRLDPDPVVTDHPVTPTAQSPTTQSVYPDHPVGPPPTAESVPPRPPGRSEHQEEHQPNIKVNHPEPPPAQLSEARTRRDELLARAAEIEARAAHDAEVCRRWPVRPMDPGVNATPEQDQIRDRFRAACERWPKTSPERTRVAACRLSTPLPHVLGAACDELGGLDGVLDVLDWAWGEVAHGRLRAIGKADAAEALRSAFRGEGAYWRGILAAYGRRPTERAPAGEWEWSTPVIADEEIVDPDTMDAMLAEALGR